ncbi:MAG TPA: ABC transporter permease [Terriglobales bacterium]|nr:ABC transporter permease [Terriglobales bacterium]
MKELRLIARRLGRAPLFTVVTLLTLGIGIGANTAVFSVVENVVLKPLPYPHPEQLVGVWQTAPGVGIVDLNMSPSNYFVFREQNHSFQDLALYTGDSVSVTGQGTPEQVSALDVTDGALPILGARTLIGRVFTRQDDQPQAPGTVVLSYGYWQRKFGGDPGVLGRTLIVDGKPRQIIGILPRRFRFLDMSDTALFLPLQFDRSRAHLGNFSYQGFARLRPGVTLAAANADVAQMWPIVLRSFPAPPGFSKELFENAKIGPNLRPLQRDVVGNVGQLLWILMASLGLVLLVACANVANLLLVRAEGRQQELAIRAALGSSRSRIAAELWLESLVIGLLGGVLGLGIAYFGLRALVAAAPSGLPRLEEIGLNGAVLGFCLAAAVFCGFVFGAAPALRYSGARTGTGLREGGRGTSESRRRHRLRNTLVAVQVGLAFVLLAASALMIRTFRALSDVPLGFAQPKDVQTFRVFIPESDTHDDVAVIHKEQAILAKLETIPGVESAAMGTELPLTNNYSQDPVFAADKTYAAGAIPPLRRFNYISPGYFHALGIPIVAGRDFTWQELYGETPVAIISANFAREYWGGPAQALGKRIRVGTLDDWREIVGVAGDVRYDGVDQKAPSAAYWPLLTARLESTPLLAQRSVAFVLRTPRAGSQAFLHEVRRAVWSLDANLPLASVDTLQVYYRRSLARTSFTLAMLAIAGAMALLLGMIGLYGVLAYSVLQRRREIGIRMALGAEPRALVGMLLGQGLLLAAIGGACGLAAALAATRLMASQLYGVKATDPTAYAAAALCLGLTALLASYLPARRAARVDPATALRAE